MPVLITVVTTQREVGFCLMGGGGVAARGGLGPGEQDVSRAHMVMRMSILEGPGDRTRDATEGEMWSSLTDIGDILNRSNPSGCP